MEKYQDVNPFDSVIDPAEWQQRVRHDWEESAVLKQHNNLTFLRST